MCKEDAINVLIKDQDVDTNKISDGYHTFGELYAHRIELFIALCNLAMRSSLRDMIKGKLRLVWKSKKHSDGTEIPGWFIAGIGTRKGDMITYHLPISKWVELPAREFERAPEWDGHTSADVLQRLRSI